MESGIRHRLFSRECLVVIRDDSPTRTLGAQVRHSVCLPASSQDDNAAAILAPESQSSL